MKTLAELFRSRPLIPLKACMVVLDLNEDQVLAQIEDGTLEYAWNIARASANRREVRVWRGSLLKEPPQPEEAVYRSLFHPRRISSVELARTWTCSGSHIKGLVADGLITGPRDSTARSGTNSMHRFEPEVLCRFLKARRII